MKRVVLVAPVLTQSGYGVHSRQIARWLLSLPGVDLQVVPVPWGDTPWLLNRDSHKGLVGELLKRSVGMDQAHGADVTFQVQLPNEWNPNLGKINVGITAGVETDRCSEEWVKACNRMSMVIVPSQHTLKSLAASGVITTKTAVVPEPFPDDIADDSLQPLPLDLPAENNFLFVAQLTSPNPQLDRKNTLLAIKWLCEEFAGREDVGIVVKTNVGRNTSIDKKIVKNIFEQVLGDVRKSAFPKVHLLHGPMSDASMSQLYKHPKIKAFVSLTRGEGFGLPILEAAAAGLPVIATNWSGHLDFLNKGKFIPVSCTLETIPNEKVDGKIFVQGTKWAQPSESDFKKRVKKFLESPSTPKGWASELREKILKEYSQVATEALLSEVTSEIL